MHCSIFVLYIQGLIYLILFIRVTNVDTVISVTYNKGKYLLRKAFDGQDYLPQSLLYREKAAFSDAVGHSLVDYLKAYAEEKYTSEDLEAAKEKYTYCTPFTKESLLYRDTFEKYYAGNAKWIKDFWMPNKSWEGCNVNDPSARVLSNYGDSGKKNIYIIYKELLFQTI